MTTKERFSSIEYDIMVGHLVQTPQGQDVQHGQSKYYPADIFDAFEPNPNSDPRFTFISEPKNGPSEAVKTETLELPIFNPSPHPYLLTFSPGPIFH